MGKLLPSVGTWLSRLREHAGPSSKTAEVTLSNTRSAHGLCASFNYLPSVGTWCANLKKRTALPLQATPTPTEPSQKCFRHMASVATWLRAKNSADQIPDCAMTPSSIRDKSSFLQAKWE